MSQLDQLFQDIKANGYQDISSLNDLMRIDKRHRDLISVILSYIDQVDDVRDKETLIRSLGVKGFSEAVEPLIEEFRSNECDFCKWAIGNTLSIIKDKESIPELIQLASQREHGHSRQMIVVALGQMKAEEALPVLIDLLDDETVAGHAVSALSYFAKPELIPHLEPFTSHEKTWIRNEAKKAIKKLKKLRDN